MPKLNELVLFNVFLVSELALNCYILFPVYSAPVQSQKASGAAV